MKRNFLIGLIAVLIAATIVYAQTVNRQPYGIGTPGLYKYTLSTNTLDSYLLSVPTLSSADTIVALAATQTLTNKIITDPDISFAVSTKVFAGGEDWTLSATEAKSILLSVESGSGTPSIAGPATSGKFYILRNSGNIAVTLKQSGKTGISVASGKTAILMNNGSDYIRVTADATH